MLYAHVFCRELFSESKSVTSIWALGSSRINVNWHYLNEICSKTIIKFSVRSCRLPHRAIAPHKLNDVVTVCITVCAFRQVAQDGLVAASNFR